MLIFILPSKVKFIRKVNKYFKRVMNDERNTILDISDHLILFKIFKIEYNNSYFRIYTIYVTLVVLHNILNTIKRIKNKWLYINFHIL